LMSTVTKFQIVSQTLFDLVGFSDTTGNQHKEIMYVDNSSVPNYLYLGSGASGYDADGFEILLVPSGISSADIFLVM